MGDPLDSDSVYLRAWVRRCVRESEETEDADEFKDDALSAAHKIVDVEFQIASEFEEVPLFLMKT